ncbi:MAG: NAD(P)-dependent oxidoreductase, partial [Bryobacterales bacterium]|nr:NAD(P)-dependent oxidoreductase [Bryobacterales bacterium]
VMGKRLYYCGPAGNGLYAKLTQNLILANLMQAFAEGMLLSTKNGIPAEMMLDILDNSAAKSSLISFKAPYILGRNFDANFSTRWMHKDVGMALESGKSHDLPLPLTAVTEQMLRVAIAKGYGDDDFCSTFRVLEDWAGMEVRK